MKSTAGKGRSHGRPTESQRTQGRGTGPDRCKIRSPIPARRQRKAASGEQYNSPP